MISRIEILTNMDEAFPDSDGTASPTTDGRSRATPQQYLREMLSLDPSEWGLRGLALRRSLLHPDSPSAPSSPAGDPKSIERLVELLQKCQRQFWEPDAYRWFSELDKESLEHAPELVPAVERLKHWFSQRELLRSLHGKFGQNSLAHHLIQLAPMTSREQAASIAQINQNRSGPLGRGLKRQASIIKRSYPTVYALAPQWFDYLIKPDSSL